MPVRPGDTRLQTVVSVGVNGAVRWGIRLCVRVFVLCLSVWEELSYLLHLHAFLSVCTEN